MGYELGWHNPLIRSPLIPALPVRDIQVDVLYYEDPGADLLKLKVTWWYQKRPKNRFVASGLGLLNPVEDRMKVVEIMEFLEIQISKG